MCVAVLCKKGAELPRSHFDSFSVANNDGYGFAYVRNKELVGFKTMKLDVFYNEYKKVFAEFGAQTPFIIHFRLGTQGTKDEFNCHPFFVSKNVAMIHNGCLPYHPKDGTDKRSDTHIFAQDHLANISDHDLMHNPTTKILLEDLITNSKIILLDVHKDYVILNEKAGSWNADNTMWFSNTYSLPGRYSWYGHKKKHKGNTNQDTHQEECNCCLCGKEIRPMWLYEIADDYNVNVFVCKDCMKKNAATTLKEFFNMVQLHSGKQIGKAEF